MSITNLNIFKTLQIAKKPEFRTTSIFYNFIYYKLLKNQNLEQQANRANFFIS